MDLEKLSESDAMEIVRNENNEYHQRLHGGDTMVKSAVENAFAKANPARDAQIRNDQQFAVWSGTAQKEGSEYEKDLDAKFAEWEKENHSRARAPSSELAGEPFGEVTEAEIQATENLKSEWGSSYDQNIQAGARALEGIFSSREQLENYVKQSGILNDPEALGDAMRLLAKIGKARG